MEIAITNLVDTLKDFELAFRKRNEFSQDGGFLLSVEINSEAFEQVEKR